MRVNSDKIAKILSEIRNSLALLHDIQTSDYKGFSDNSHIKSSAKYNFIVVIEGMIDLCSHLISQNGFRTPEDYADTFKVAAEHGVIDNELCSSLVKAARFRNRLVHIYWEITDRDLFEIIKSGPEDVKRFLDQYSRFIDIT